MDGTGFSPGAAATRRSAYLRAGWREGPSGPHAGDLLAVLGRQLETAVKTHRMAQSLAIIVGDVRAEQEGTDATRRRQDTIALQRMYIKAPLEAMAHLAKIQHHVDYPLRA